MIHESREPPQSPDLNLGVKMSVKAANMFYRGKCFSTWGLHNKSVKIVKHLEQSMRNFLTFFEGVCRS